MYAKWRKLSLTSKIGVLGSIASIIGLALFLITPSSNNNPDIQESSGECSPNISKSRGDINIDCSTRIDGRFTDPEDKSKTSALRRVPIKYVSELAEGSIYSRLKADINGNEYLIIDENEELCLTVYDERDYDGNGSKDALVTNITACGGNCCGNSFFFISYLGDGHFQTSAAFRYSWEDPEIEKWKDFTSVLVTDINEGVNQNSPEEITVRYVLDSGKAVKVEESERRSLVALEEMRSNDFNFNKNNELRSLKFDLNGDGITDHIVGRLWHRWGRILWTVKLSGTGEINPNIACKRVGILSTKTGNHYNIVCDQDDVLRWNGESYL